MGRRIRFDVKRNLPKIILLIIVAAIAAVCARVLIWEHFYYSEKEGSERATSVTSPGNDEESVDESEVTENEVLNYTVSPDRPRYLSIEKLGVANARILPVGLNSSNQLETPNNIFDVGWYTESGKPGAGGTLVIDGHNGGPTKTGVFKNLPSLSEGDTITIERGDGEVFTYSVIDNIAYSLDEANANMGKAFVSPVPGKESLTLITCSGDWSDVQKTYLSRQFVRAILIEN